LGVSAFLDLIAGQPTQKLETGAIALEQGGASDHLLVLIEGEVEVLRDDIRIVKVATPGALFGEMSILLNCPLTATVRTLRPSVFAVISQPREFLTSSSAASLQVAELLAGRLDALNKYLIDVKQQYEGHDHLGMVDEVLETLMNRPARPPRPAPRPEAPPAP
jgi:CRP/FNR family cyclic AMP-dependent transcriptional regulator